MVFLDPPYSASGRDVRDVLASLLASGRLAGGALVVVERSSRDPAWVWPVDMLGVRAKQYGETMLWYGHRA